MVAPSPICSKLLLLTEREPCAHVELSIKGVSGFIWETILAKEHFFFFRFLSSRRSRRNSYLESHGVGGGSVRRDWEMVR